MTPDRGAPPPPAHAISLDRIRVTRDDVVLLDDLDLEIAAGERLAILGPSGSGKTTLLRVIAGLEPVTAGEVRFDGRDMADVPPRDRDLGMVTQEGALQPHLDVRRNLSFPLRVRRTPKDEIDRRVDAEARAFSLGDVLGRRPRTLSAGRRHEVALAHTLVRRVAVLLADEPFGLMDAGRRDHLQRELVALQAGYGLTLVVATNDQRVALSVADRVAVLRDGRLEQVAPPLTIYDEPATVFVAGFVGEPPMELRSGRLRWEAGVPTIEAGPLRCRARPAAVHGVAAHQLLVGVRPAAWRLAPTTSQDGAGLTVTGTVRSRAFLGADVDLRLDVDGDEVRALVPNPGPTLGAVVSLRLPTKEVHLFDAVSGRALVHGV